MASVGNSPVPPAAPDLRAGQRPMVVRAPWLPVAPGIADALVTARVGRPLPTRRHCGRSPLRSRRCGGGQRRRSRRSPSRGSQWSRGRPQRSTAPSRRRARGAPRAVRDAAGQDRAPATASGATAGRCRGPGPPGHRRHEKRIFDGSGRRRSGAGVAVRAAAASADAPAAEHIDDAVMGSPATGRPTATRDTGLATSAEAPAGSAGPRSPRSGELTPPPEAPAEMARTRRPDPAPAPRLPAQTPIGAGTERLAPTALRRPRR